MAGPTADKCQVSVTAFTGTFAAAGGTGSVTLSTSRECSWSAATSTQWISLPASPTGQGQGAFSFKVGANPAPRPREGAIEVAGQRLGISQEAAPCRFDLDRRTTRAAASGGSASVAVTTTDGCGWSARSLAPWVRLIRGERGEGPGVVSFVFEPNRGAARSGDLVVAGLTHRVEQAAAAGPPSPGPPPDPPPPDPPPPDPPPPDPPPPSPEPCEYRIAPAAAVLPASGGSLTLSLTTGSVCTWEASSDAGWATVGPPSAGTGSAAIPVSVNPNPDVAPRQALVRVASATVALNQEGAPLPEVRLEGRIQGLSGSCPSRRFRIRGDVVVTTAATRYGPDPPGTSCGDLREGRTVVVTGAEEAGAITASLVIFEINGLNP